MAIRIQNLRIMPWNQKDTLKAVFGDTLELTIHIPHVDGESYMCGLDNERVVYPPSRPICAYTNVFERDGDNVTFKLNLTTSKLRTFVSGIKKPMPVWLQVVREVNGKYETILLDDILAIPSVIDGAMTVCEGDPLKELLEAKMDKPYTEGTEGQILTMGENGHYAWADLPEIPEQEQADWDTSDSSEVSFIRNKPDLSIYVEKEAGKGLSTNDFTDEDKNKLEGIEDGAEVNVQADWDVSESTDESYIRHKPTLSNVARTGSYNDLIDKPVIPEPTPQVQADWEESDSSEKSYILNKPTIGDATVTINQGGVQKGTFTLNQTSNATIDLNDGAQSDWDESDSSEVSYILNKPVIPEDALDYLCISAAQSNAKVSIDKVNNPPSISLEYSTDKKTWTTYTWSDSTGTVITLANIGDCVWWRGDNTGFSTMTSFHKFNSDNTLVDVSGNVMSILDKSCASLEIPSEYCFQNLFSGTKINICEIKLPATILKAHCYQQMFYFSQLKSVPLLPAAVLETECYKEMFANCNIREFDMSTAMPNMTQDNNHANDERMAFAGLFRGCYMLTRVKVNVSNWGHYDDQFTNWLDGAGSYVSNHVFECPSTLNCSTRDASHVPAGWTIVRYDAPWSDWNQTNVTEGSYIKNKPTIPAPQVQSDWDESNSSELSYIKNKPDITFVETVTTIPDATTNYLFPSDGYYSHSPSSAPTYTMPSVSDMSIVHEIVLDVLFSSDVLSYTFESSGGSAIVPESMPMIAPRRVVSFICRYVPLLARWVVLPVPVGDDTSDESDSSSESGSISGNVTVTGNSTVNGTYALDTTKTGYGSTAVYHNSSNGYYIFMTNDDDDNKGWVFGTTVSINTASLLGDFPDYIKTDSSTLPTGTWSKGAFVSM